MQRAAGVFGGPSFLEPVNAVEIVRVEELAGVIVEGVADEAA